MEIFTEELIIHIIWASVITIISILVFIWNMKNNKGDEKKKQIGNYFGTEQETEKAVEKQIFGGGE